jgi:hypothetical protein
MGRQDRPRPAVARKQANSRRSNTVALAGALAFGLGGRNVAQEVVEGYYERRDEAKQQIREQRQDRQRAGSSDIAPDEAERPEARLRRE